MASSFKMKPKIQILRERGLNKGGEGQRYVDSEVIRRMSPFTPKMDGTLIDSATKMTTIGSGTVKQGGRLAPYGIKWYYKEAKFTGAPMRGTFWFERMKNSGGAKGILQGLRRIVK